SSDLERHRRRQRVIPAVLPDSGEEQIQLPDQHAVSHSARVSGMQLREVALQQFSVQVRQPLGHRNGALEELPERGDRAGADGNAPRTETGSEPPPGPPFRQSLQPGLWNALEGDMRQLPVLATELT